MSRVGFLHTAEVHVATFDALVGDAAETVHVVEPDLLERARREGPTPTVASGVRAALAELAGAGADVVVCTCSTLGPLAEAADVSVRVLRVDRPMARRAVAIGQRIAVVAAVESTLAPTRELLDDEAARAGATPTVTEVCVPAAWTLFEEGDIPAYLAAVADAARSAASSADVVLLAQASMADALDLLADLGVPVLVSPRLAVEGALDGADPSSAIPVQLRESCHFWGVVSPEK